MADKESMFWADQIGREVKARVEADARLGKIVKKHGYIIYDEKTPSGAIHIGSGRGWIIHDVIAKSMRDMGLKARFILSSDDIDPFDKMPSYIDKSYEQYLGMPFRNIPSHVEGYKSFADYYFMQCVEKFEEFGIEAEIRSTGEEYESGNFNSAIKTILDNADKVKSIFERIYDKPYDKLPFNPICEKCGRIGTTKAISWDSEKELLKYRCEENLVEWAHGCGHEGEISPYDGNGKFPWKVEWAAKWPTVGVVCEFAGKDHFTRGGSRDVAIAISSEVLDYPPPYPSTRNTAGKGYEFFNVGGKKMSTSKGIGYGFAEMFNYVPVKILRYLLVRTRPHAVIDFNPEGTNDLILLYDRYDKTERYYFDAEPESNEQELANQKRIYELSHIGIIPDRLPMQIPLTFAATVRQIGLTDEGALDVLRKTGHISQDTAGIDLHAVLERLHDAEKWLNKFAPEQYKFTLQEKAQVKPDSKEKKALQEVVNILDKKKLGEKELHAEFYAICEKLGLDTKDFFRAAYSVLINRESGPKLASFLLALGKERVAMLFGNL